MAALPAASALLTALNQNNLLSSFDSFFGVTDAASRRTALFAVVGDPNYKGASAFIAALPAASALLTALNQNNLLSSFDSFFGVTDAASRRTALFAVVGDPNYKGASAFIAALPAASALFSELNQNNRLPRSYPSFGSTDPASRRTALFAVVGDPNYKGASAF